MIRTGADIIDIELGVDSSKIYLIQSGESNRVVSKYKIYTSASGKKLLSENGIPDVFPCVIENRENNFYYFAGDFCDNPIYIESAKFLVVTFLHKFFYDKYNYIDRTSASLNSLSLSF